MTSTFKRRLSILLCVAMVLAMMPMAVSAASTTTVYFANTGNWSAVAVYWWGSADTNPSWPGQVMTDLGNGYWSYDVSSDITGIIFNNNNNGAQTSDLSLPTDGSNCYNNTDGTWSVYTGAEVEVVETEYFLRGNMNGWAADEDSKMVKQDDGTYAITLSLAAGTYEYKAAVADWSWSIPGDANATLTLEKDTDVTFVLDVSNNTLTNDAPIIEEPTDPSEEPTDPTDPEDYTTYPEDYTTWTEDETTEPTEPETEPIEPSEEPTEPETEPVEDSFYVVAGSSDLCGDGNTGYGWDSTDLNNLMTDNGDGTYSKVYYDVAVMNDYQLKVVEVYADGTAVWYGVNGSNNVTFNVTAVCDVTVTFDTTTQEITVTGDGVEVDSGFEVESIRVVGNGYDCWLNGALWDPADDSNLMTEITPGVYSITYTNVECFDNYQFKFAADGSWAYNWGGIYEGSGVVSAAVLNANDNITIDVPYELADVTLTLDLTAFDASTNTGATFTVEIVDTSEPTEPTDPTDPSEEPSEPVNPSEPVQIEKVEGLTEVSVGYNDFSIEWDAVEGATKYWVYVDGAVYASTTGTSLTVTNREMDTEYAVSVTALLEDGTILSLDKAEEISVVTECRVLDSTYDSDTNSITINFNALDASKIWIYFGTSEDDLKLYGSTTEDSYTISNLKPDTQYFYKLSFLVDGQIVEDISVTAICTTPDYALDVTATQTEGSLQLDWEASGDSWKYWVIVETAEKTYIYSTTETEYTLSGFNFAACTISVRGVNSDGMYDYNPIDQI